MSAPAPIPALDLAPHMPDAACVGQSALHDPATAGEHPVTVARRHMAAIEACRLCPTLHQCAAWLNSLPKSKRPEGVTAGRIWQPTAPGGKRYIGRAGRPRKAR